MASLTLLGVSPLSIEQVGRTRTAIVLPEHAPAGSVIIIPGGSTRQTIDEHGESDAMGNFVMRVRDAFVEDGFAIAYMEDPSDLRPAIARMRRIARPVFLVSTSNGTAVAARIAATLGADGPDGIVLTSTVTIQGRRFPYTAAGVDVGRITAPVLFVHNRNDTCFASRPDRIAGLIARFAPGTSVTRIDVASEPTANDPCGPFAPHGYLGIETDVVARIVAWMHVHGAPQEPK